MSDERRIPLVITRAVGSVHITVPPGYVEPEEPIDPVEEQMNRVATIRGQLGQARDAIRAALKSYGSAEARRILEQALEPQS